MQSRYFHETHLLFPESRSQRLEPVMVIYKHQDEPQYDHDHHKQQYYDHDDDNQLELSMTPPTQHYLTIEELRSARNSCWLCGCNWQQDHVSLDCPECGGYALTRPCPNCDGKCKQVWRRNINATHDHHKALWVGQCHLRKPVGSPTAAPAKEDKDPYLSLPVSQLYPSSLPSSAASSDSESDCLVGGKQ